MALKAFIESLDEVDEQIAGNYVERSDGEGFVLDVESAGGLSLEDTSGLRSALQKERGEKRALAERVKVFDGFDIDQAREDREKIEAMKDAKPDEKWREQLAARERALTEKFNADIEAERAGKAEAHAQLGQYIGRASAMAAIATHRGNPELLLPIVERHIRVTRNDQGEFSAKVVGEDGHPRISQLAGQSGDMQLDEFVAGMAQDKRYQAAFEAEHQSGTGAGGEEGSLSGGAEYSRTESGVLTLND